MTDEFRAIAHDQESARRMVLAGCAHAKAMLDNGERVLITFGPALEPISVQQRKFLHGVVLEQISEQVKVGGQRYTIDVWKEYFRKKFLPPKWRVYKMPGAKRATPHREEQSTERLGVRAYSKFIDNVIDHATLEWSVAFQFQAEERDAVRYTEPARKPKSTAEAGAA